MGIIDKHKEEIDKQFISIHDAIHLIAQAENCDPTTATSWLLSQDYILKRQRYLQRPDNFTLQDYEPVDSYTREYIEPYIAATALIQRAYVDNQYSASDEINYINLGFARQNLLHSLATTGIEIPKELLLATNSYIPNENNLDDCSPDYIHLVEQLKIVEKENFELKTQQNQCGNPAIGQPDASHYQRERDQYKQQCEQQQTEIDQLKHRIAELEANSIVSNNPDQLNLFDLITNETHAQHAPDLGHAVKLWLHLYHNNHNSNDSHTNRAIIWIKGNTGYTDMQTGGRQAMNRIREITTPFKEWGGQRNKNYKKI